MSNEELVTIDIEKIVDRHLDMYWPNDEVEAASSQHEQGVDLDQGTAISEVNMSATTRTQHPVVQQIDHPDCAPASEPSDGMDDGVDTSIFPAC
jgi:hypothetical protein